MSINQPMNPERLATYPVENDFRLRGIEMTRIEVFTDAVFAFALTMLVISFNEIPRTFEQLVVALKFIPAFAASFLHVMMFWAGHRRWSRRFGLEDNQVVWLSGFLVFVMLVFVYPLRLLFGSAFAWLSNGWLPVELVVTTWFDLRVLFTVYGIGFGLLCLSLAALYAHGYALRDSLRLSSVEILITRGAVIAWLSAAGVAVVSVLLAMTLPDRGLAWAGFAYGLMWPAGMVRRRYLDRARQRIMAE